MGFHSLIAALQHPNHESHEDYGASCVHSELLSTNFIAQSKPKYDPYIPARKVTGTLFETLIVAPLPHLLLKHLLAATLFFRRGAEPGLFAGDEFPENWIGISPQFVEKCKA